MTPTTDEPRSPVSAAGLCWARDLARGGALGLPTDRPTSAPGCCDRPVGGLARPGPTPSRRCQRRLAMASGASARLRLWTTPHAPRGLSGPAAALGAAPPGRHARAARLPAPPTQAPGGGATSGAPSARRAGATGARRRWGVRGHAPRCPRPRHGTTPPSSSPGRGGTHPAPEGARTRWRSPVPHRAVRPIVPRHPPRGGRISWPGKGPPWAGVAPAPGVPNAGPQAPPEAAAT